MSISTYLEPITKVKELMFELLKTELGISEVHISQIYNDSIRNHFDKLKNTCYLLAETNYVDKVYRDSFYHYYSSKLGKYKRDCVRISIFDGEVQFSDFGDNTKQRELQQKYRGFIVLRPTNPFIIGRSIISPLALQNNNFNCCVTKFHTTAKGQKFTVRGFPHSSQDTETISCAETTLWAVMEYFGNKYPDYKPILPSKIIQALDKVSFERQIPSKGLNINQMSFALKEFGFGSRIYSHDEYNGDFETLLSCYIESGMPVIIAMQGGNIGHALLAIGREKIDEAKITAIPAYTPTNTGLKSTLTTKRISIFDYHSSIKDFIFIDDNCPVYQRAKLDNPATHYPVSWHSCKITYFIAPLYPKIYLEAYEAKKWILHFLTSGPLPLSDGSEVLIRSFLASSRSFKDELSQSNTLCPDFKNILIETSMPKFIWVTEISTKNLMKQGKANGLIILDATEANTFFNKPLIIAAYQGNMISFDDNTGILEKNSLPLSEFEIFDCNLNCF